MIEWLSLATDAEAGESLIGTDLGGIMEIETLEAMNKSMYLSEMMLIEVTVWIIILFAVVGFAIYLASIAWLCFEEMRRPARRQAKPAPGPGPAEYDALSIPVTLDDD